MKNLKAILLFIPKATLKMMLYATAMLLMDKAIEMGKTRRKLKHFKPIIKESRWGTTVEWHQRDTPLTDDQLNNL